MARSLTLAAVALFALACTGPRGPMGPAGMTGAQGPPGMTGSQGSRGLTGSQGQPGAESQGPSSSGAGWTSLRDITFDYDKTDIRPTEMTKIADVASYLNQNPSVGLGIDGSTDLLRGSNQYNVSLSQARISNVRDALIKSGVSASRIEVGGFGTERPKCTDSDEQPCAQRDGRVELLAHSNR
jgi:peptidoglycan-associated lipoprotein